MNILNFIVIEGRPDFHGDDNGTEIYRYTMQGECSIPLDTPVPIIRRGTGCIGIGTVTKLQMTRTSTTMYYTIADISESNARAYYDLFRNQATVSNLEEYQEDVIIPGMMRNISASPRPKYDGSGYGKKKKKESHRSLMDYPNAYEDDY